MFIRKPNESPGAEASYGYLTAIFSPEYGYFGGYLIVSLLGRPLEFHCTAPVRPSRAQEILYGPTLHAYLLGEQISGAMLEAAKQTPNLILTDQAAVMNIRPQITVPLVFVVGTVNNDADSGATVDTLSSHEPAVGGGVLLQQLPTGSGGEPFVTANYALQLPSGYAADEPAVESLLADFAQHVDLVEPFGRIREAIREAQRLGTRSTEGHGQAA